MARDSKTRKKKKKSQAEINRENLQAGISLINQHPLFGGCFNCHLIYDGKNISCKFCEFKDLCFMSNSNLKYLDKVEDLSFLGGDNNA